MNDQIRLARRPQRYPPLDLQRYPSLDPQRYDISWILLHLIIFIFSLVENPLLFHPQAGYASFLSPNWILTTMRNTQLDPFRAIVANFRNSKILDFYRSIDHRR